MSIWDILCRILRWKGCNMANCRTSTALWILSGFTVFSVKLFSCFFKFCRARWHNYKLLITYSIYVEVSGDDLSLTGGPCTFDTVCFTHYSGAFSSWPRAWSECCGELWDPKPRCSTELQLDSRWWLWISSYDRAPQVDQNENTSCSGTKQTSKNLDCHPASFVTFAGILSPLKTM